MTDVAVYPGTYDLFEDFTHDHGESHVCWKGFLFPIIILELNDQEIQKLIEWAKKYGDIKIKELDLKAAEVKELV